LYTAALEGTRVLRALILSNRRGEASRRDEARFGSFASALALGGIKAVHRFVDTVGELDSCLGSERPDIVFSAAYSVAPDIDVAGRLEGLSVPFVGSSPEALRLVLSKAALKDRWRERGIPTPEYFSVARPGAALDGALARASRFPYIVKPAREGNSRGIGPGSVVFCESELRDKVVSLIALYGEVLVESYLGDDPGMREFTVAMLGPGRGGLYLPAEIRLERAAGLGKAPRVVTTADKDSGAARALPVEEPLLRAELSSLAERACAAAGVRDYARCDIIRSRGTCYAIEINGEPMVPDPWFEACAAGAGLDPDQYLLAIFFAALARLERAGGRGEVLRASIARPAMDAMGAALPPDIRRRLSASE
jgi:D-alanine-D-alanine ligase-like ATP-grasp enzyme